MDIKEHIIEIYWSKGPTANYHHPHQRISRILLL